MDYSLSHVRAHMTSVIISLDTTRIACKCVTQYYTPNDNLYFHSLSNPRIKPYTQ